MVLEDRVTVTVHSETSGRFSLLCTLRYSPADPYAVQLLFPRLVAHTKPNAWSFSRELLTAGLEGPAGLGDVRVRPAADDQVAMTLYGKNGTATLTVNADRLRSFLLLTQGAVPPGTESRLIDWDLLSEQLSSHTS
ncbi:SsgA family sporulation/cell division regulator [Streptacidiphilus neutrinimicus]|uniref:SsgA family sporulation/cell division regulator n=1 Tax=Streptacidiphilus neutrinimicus TaxID=105420 RepID=UPI0005A8EEC3|nr:SsgA family sporulation/cell division regulator [Streptacidiphilus neutrinimicus]